MSYQSAFGDSFAVPAEVTDTLTDISYRNDIAPSFTLQALMERFPDDDKVRLWVDHPDAAEREYPENPRYFVTVDAFAVAVQTDDLAEALRVFHDCARVALES